MLESSWIRGMAYLLGYVISKSNSSNSSLCLFIINNSHLKVKTFVQFLTVLFRYSRPCSSFSFYAVDKFYFMEQL